MMNYAFTESSLLDMKTLMPVSFAVMALMLALPTRGFSGTFATILVVTLSILTAMGLGGWAGFPFTPPSAAIVESLRDSWYASAPAVGGPCWSSRWRRMLMKVEGRTDEGSDESTDVDRAAGGRAPA